MNECSNGHPLRSFRGNFCPDCGREVVFDMRRLVEIPDDPEPSVPKPMRFHANGTSGVACHDCGAEFTSPATSMRRAEAEYERHWMRLHS